MRKGIKLPLAGGCAAALMFLIALGAAGFLGISPLNAQAAEKLDFMADVADLPLMPGLEEVPDAGMTFDTASGRIVEAYAEGAVAREDVIRFYLSTLPQLGWEAKADSLFSREGERLQMIYLEDKGALVVRFTLQPE